MDWLHQDVQRALEDPARFVRDLDNHDNGIGIHWATAASTAEYFALHHDPSEDFVEHSDVVIARSG
jgi:hypothetical protein